jgi:translation initiation factor 4G
MTSATPSYASAAQNVKSSSKSPVNGRTAMSTTVPSGPAIVSSGTIANGADHSRKPSSVTLSASMSGSVGYMANGNSAAGPSPRPNISFGSINANSPAIANSVPHISHNSNLGTVGNPGPARSPSPIPHQTVSGGRPPSGPQGPGNQLNFGSLPGGESVEQNVGGCYTK